MNPRKFRRHVRPDCRRVARGSGRTKGKQPARKQAADEPRRFMCFAYTSSRNRRAPGSINRANSGTANARPINPTKNSSA